MMQYFTAFLRCNEQNQIQFSVEMLLIVCDCEFTNI